MTLHGAYPQKRIGPPQDGHARFRTNRPASRRIGPPQDGQARLGGGFAPRPRRVDFSITHLSFTLISELYSDGSDEERRRDQAQEAKERRRERSEAIVQAAAECGANTSVYVSSTSVLFAN